MVPVTDSRSDGNQTPAWDASKVRTKAWRHMPLDSLEYVANTGQTRWQSVTGVERTSVNWKLRDETERIAAAHPGYGHRLTAEMLMDSTLSAD